MEDLIWVKGQIEFSKIFDWQFPYQLVRVLDKLLLLRQNMQIFLFQELLSDNQACLDNYILWCLVWVYSSFRPIYPNTQGIYPNTQGK